MDLQPRSTLSQAVSSLEYIQSKHGQDTVITITLDMTAFDAGTHYVAADGFIPGGTPIKKVGSLWVPAEVADTSAPGYLYAPITVKAGATKAGGSLFWHGVVLTSALNNAFAPDALPTQILHI